MVLLIAYLYPPDNYSGAARAGRFGKYLQQKGYQVEVLSACTPAKLAVEGNVHRVRGELEFREQSDFSALLERAARKLLFPADVGCIWSLRAGRYGKRFMKGSARPVVISTSPPVFTHAVAWWFKKRFGVRWIADFRDPFVGMPSRQLHRTRWLDPRMEQAIFRNADAIIANTDRTAEMWRKRYAFAADRIHLIWNGFDPEERLGPEPLPERGHAMLSHVGDIYGDRRPDVLLESMARLLAAGKLDPHRVCIHLAGPLDREAIRKPELLDKLVEDGCVTLTPRVPRAEANRIIATSDYLLLLDVFPPGGSVQVPAKIFDYVRIGRPILACTRQGTPVDNILAMSGIRYVTVSEDDAPAEADRKVREFFSFPSTPEPMSEEFRNSFDGYRQVEHLSRIIDSLTAVS